MALIKLITFLTPVSGFEFFVQLCQQSSDKLICDQADRAFARAELMHTKFSYCFSGFA